MSQAVAVREDAHLLFAHELPAFRLSCTGDEETSRSYKEENNNAETDALKHPKDTVPQKNDLNEGSAGTSNDV